jgi:IS30 family transposase
MTCHHSLSAIYEPNRLKLKAVDVRNGPILGANCRTRVIKLPHPKPATAAHVLQAFTDKLQGIAKPLRLSLTYDQGKEMAYHRQLTEATGIAVYFCDPHSPWQRGSNENTNGLVRQYLPKGTDLSGYTQEQLDAIADEINGRPRKGLGVRSPLSVYAECLAESQKTPSTQH